MKRSSPNGEIAKTKVSIFSMTWRARNLRITHYCISPRSQKCIWPARQKQKICQFTQMAASITSSGLSIKRSNWLNSRSRNKTTNQKGLWATKEGIQRLSTRSQEPMYYSVIFLNPCYLVMCISLAFFQGSEVKHLRERACVINFGGPVR